MVRLSTHIERVLKSPDLRILSVMVAGIAVFGVVDGSLWRGLLTPTLAYRPAILFGLMLVFGWRGFVWSQLLFLISFVAFLGWRGAVLVAPLYLISNACALVVARRLARSEPWLLRQRSTLAFLAGAVLAPAVPALLNSTILRVVGDPQHAGVLSMVDSWLRAGAGILALAPAVLVYLSGPLKDWTASDAESEWQPRIATREVLWLAVEVGAWTATFWMSVQFKVEYGLNVSYLTFLPPLALTLYRGMRLAVLALAANAMIASTLWYELHWEQALSAGDLRLLIAIYSLTILVFAAVVDERQRDRGQVEKLRIAADALRESEECFRVAFYQAAVGIAQTGTDGQWLFVNDRYCEMFGYSQTELRGKNFLDVTHPDDSGASRKALRQLLAGDISSLLKEKRYIRKDGGIVWVRLFTALVRDQHHQPQYFISVLEDITDQKRIEERLQASEARLMEAQHLAKVGSWERRVKSDTIQWSEEIPRILGLPINAPANFPVFVNSVHPKDRAKILEIEDKVRSSIAPVEVEYRIIRPDGEARFVRSVVEGIRDDHGEMTRVVGATQDITEQVKARELLRESEGHLKNAARLAHVGYFQWNIQANQVSGSEEMFRIFGKPPHYTPTFDDFLQTVIPQDRERVTQWVSDCLAEKRGSEIEYQIAWPSGDLRVISCISELFLGEDGLPTRLFGACQDVTDVKKNEAKLVQVQEDLRGLTARLVDLQELGMKELARELHDDLSQHLAALGMEIETLLLPLAQPYGPLSERAYEVWRRVTKLARDVHSMSQRLHPAILDELGLKEALIEQCRAFSERTGIPVQFESAGESTWPGADVSLCFYRVAQEGLHNIAKHAGATSIHLTLSSSEEKCTLWIEDNGQGFDPSEAKGKNALGLISMRERARLVNGNFTIRSEYGKGTMLEVSVALKTN
jgi:PAS domain S-box-containing protein